MITPEAQRRLDLQKKLTDQLIINPNFKISGLITDPYTPYFRTNNFIQQTASRIFGYDPTEGVEEWFALRTDSEGRLLVSPTETTGAWFRLKDRDNIRTTIFEDFSIPNNAGISHAGVLLAGTSKQSILISCNGALTLYYQTSDNNVDWYTIQTTAGNDYTLAVTGASEAFPINDATYYFRVFISNTSGAAVTATLKIIGLV